MREISKEQFIRIQGKRLDTLKGVVQKYIDETIKHPPSQRWLDGVQLWAGNNNERQYIDVKYGLFLNGDSSTSRSLRVLTDLEKAVKAFGFTFEAWGMRGGNLYLTFSEAAFLVKNPDWVDPAEMARRDLEEILA